MFQCLKSWLKRFEHCNHRTLKTWLLMGTGFSSRCGNRVKFLILLAELKLKLREAANEREWFLIKGSTQHVKVIAMMIFSFYKTDI